MNDDISKDELIAKVHALEAQVHSLEKDLIHDSLTLLKTRAFFEEEARVYLDSVLNVKEGQRKEWFGFRHLSFIFLDIDHFKNINDTYGHAVGDMVLKKVAETIQKGLRQGDTASRWGGEEMVVLLLGANESDAVHKAEDIRHSVEALVFTDHPDLKVTISSGVASAEEGLSLDALVKRADEALYSAKESGRNKVVAHSQLKNN